MYRNGGYTTVLSSGSTSRTTVRAHPATLGVVVARNLGNALAYVSVFDDVDAYPATAPVFVIPVPASGQVELCHLGLHVQVGLRLSSTADYARSTGAAGDVVISIAID